MNKTKLEFKVRIQCMTYNHAPYIEDAMNGFCIQQTDFPFLAVVVDDASTDGEPEVIKKYLAEHFDNEALDLPTPDETDEYVRVFARHKENKNCYFLVMFLKYNHYSIKKAKLVSVADLIRQIPYIALCEGDDYWTDPMKLQKQVDFMEEHKDCSMTCSRVSLFSESKHHLVGETGCYIGSQVMNPADIIEQGGMFISTCSIVYKHEIQKNYPDYCRKCHVGDYPLQIMAAMKGMVFYFNDNMAVYRVDNPMSWIGKLSSRHTDSKYIEGVKSEIRMLLGYSKDYPEYTNSFEKRVKLFVLSNLPDKKKHKDLYKEYKSMLKKDIRQLGWKNRMIVFLIMSRFQNLYFSYKKLKKRI